MNTEELYDEILSKIKQGYHYTFTNTDIVTIGAKEAHKMVDKLYAIGYPMDLLYEEIYMVDYDNEEVIVNLKELEW